MLSRTISTLSCGKWSTARRWQNLTKKLAVRKINHWKWNVCYFFFFFFLEPSPTSISIELAIRRRKRNMWNRFRFRFCKSKLVQSLTDLWPNAHEVLDVNRTRTSDPSPPSLGGGGWGGRMIRRDAAPVCAPIQQKPKKLDFWHWNNWTFDPRRCRITQISVKQSKVFYNITSYFDRTDYILFW